MSAEKNSISCPLTSMMSRASRIKSLPRGRMMRSSADDRPLIPDRRMSAMNRVLVDPSALTLTSVASLVPLASGHRWTTWFQGPMISRCPSRTNLASSSFDSFSFS